jgi:hypothetical protein
MNTLTFIARVITVVFPWLLVIVLVDYIVEQDRTPPLPLRCDAEVEAGNIPESILPESIKPALEDCPLPRVFADWIAKKGLK